MTCSGINLRGVRFVHRKILNCTKDSKEELKKKSKNYSIFIVGRLKSQKVNSLQIDL